MPEMRVLDAKKKIVVSLVIALAAFLLILAQQAPAAGPYPDSFSIIEDAQLGHVTAENENLKVVWHYSAQPSERNNRSGGNIYELYDKRTDPSASRNLVAVYDSGGSETTPNTPGIGGLGATHMWELGRSVSASDNARFSRLVSKDYYIDGEGNAVFQAAYIVKSSLMQYASNENLRPDNYRVDKKWTVFPSGQVKLDISMQILRDVIVAEPAYDFSFSQDYGFSTASSLGHKWNRECEGVDTHGSSNANNSMQTLEGINMTPDYDNQLLHSEFFSLYGRPGGSTIRVKMDNDGKGFENGGLFGLGASVWGNVQNPTVEYSNYREAAYGHTLRFFAWWGGGPPSAQRHKQLNQGTRWSDSVWIEVYPVSSPEAPQMIVGPQVEQLEPGKVSIDWETDIAADTRITVQKQGDSRSTTQSIAGWTPSHRIDLAGLMPGSTYSYEVRSSDGSGEAIATGTFIADGTLTPRVSLVPNGQNVRWASYSDYSQRLLTVNIEVLNIGTEAAVTAEVLMATADSAINTHIVETQLGTIPSGEQRSMRILYELPPAVTVFHTNIYLRAMDADGTQYFFPSAPPTGA